MKLSSLQCRALLKIAVDLVKSDYQIHSDEIVALQKIQEECKLDVDETEWIHYLTLQEAIDVLSSLDEDTKLKLLQQLENLIKIDNDVDFHENLLLSSIKLCLTIPKEAKIISVPNAYVECDSHQIVYLEHQCCDDAHRVLDDKYDYVMISNILSSCKMQLFYLPKVVQFLLDGEREQNVKLLRQSVAYVVPSSYSKDQNDFNNLLQQMDVVKFTKLVETQSNILPEQIGMDAFFMVTLQDTFVLDDDANRLRNRDYLCINAATSLKSNVMKLVELMQSPNYSISFFGYYRFLFDFLNADLRLMSTILINHNNDFVLPDLGDTIVEFKSAPQAKTFYLLLLYYPYGITQSLWNSADELCGKLAVRMWIDIMDLKIFLMNSKDEVASLIYNILVLYETISNRSVDVYRMIEYVRSIINHRSSLKNYINASINQIEKLAHKNFYLVEFNAASESYRIGLTSEWVDVFSKDGNVNIVDSALWKKMIRFSKRLD